MNEWSKCLGYTGTPCSNCGRYRLERFGNGKERCEKCEWCPQDKRYVGWEEMIDMDEILKGGAE